MTVTQAAIPREDFEEGQTLPRICALSGDEADRLYRVNLNHLPSWVYALLPIGLPFALAVALLVSRLSTWSIPWPGVLALGFLPFVVGWYFTAVKILGWVPLTTAVQREITRQRQLRWAAAAAFCIFGFIAVVSFNTWGTVGVLPALLAVFALGSFLSLSWELGSLDLGVQYGPGPHRITVINVHPTFATAAADKYGHSFTS